MAELSVEISAKIDRLQKELAKAKGEFKGLESAANKTNTKLGKSTDRVAKGMKNLRGQTINGNSAMTAFSRTIQDAPFGIMGVSNNITNLTEQFGYLKNKTGSAGGALKAMLRDMKGFGGITLAISIATSLLLVFGDEIGALFSKTKKLQTAFKDSSESIGNQINKLKGLTDALVSNNTSTEDKVRILAKLKKEYPKYFNNLSLENTNINTVTKAYLKQKNAIIGLGVTKALESKKAPEYAKLAELELKSQKDLLSASDNLSFSTLGGGMSGLGVSGGNNDADAIAKRIKELAKISKAKQIAAIMKNISEIDKAADNIKKRFEVSDIDLLNLDNASSSNKGREKVRKFYEELGTEFVDKNAEFQELIELNPITLTDSAEWGSIDWEAYYNLKKLDKINTDLKLKAEEINKSMDNLLVSSVSRSLSNLAMAIGQGTANATQAIMGGMGSLLSAMGDKLIQLGTAAVLAGTITKLFGSISGIGAGLAAIAGGIALKAIGTGIGNFGGAGNSGSRRGVSDDTGSYSPSGGSSSSSNGNGGGGTYVFEIQGTKLVGVLSNTLARNRSLGGSLSLT